MNKKTALRLLLRFSSYALFDPPWLLFAGLPAMMFDSPDTEENAGHILSFIAIWPYPFAVFASGANAWLAYRARRYGVLLRHPAFAGGADRRDVCVRVLVPEGASGGMPDAPSSI